MTSLAGNATVPVLLPKIPSLDNTYGALMLGTFCGLMLYGLAVHLPSYKKDATYIKVMVAFVLCFQFLQLRGLSTALTVEAFVQPDLVHFQRFSWMFMTALAIMIAADGILTVILTVVLHRSRTGFKSTDSLINVLIMYTINTGSSPSPHADRQWAEPGGSKALNSRHFLANYAKRDYGCTPDQTSAISLSALGKNSHYGASGCSVCQCRPNASAACGLSVQPHETAEVVLAIRAVRGADVSYCEDSIFTDQRSEPSVAHHEQGSSTRG
ncbi:hypothetical protein V8D89_001575 [Ganoderma adspersum]